MAIISPPQRADERPVAATMRALHRWRCQPLCMLLIVVGATSLALADDDMATARKQFEQHVQPLFARYCLDCHGPNSQEKNLRLDQLGADFTNTANRMAWQTVLKRLQAGEMPPADHPQPSAPELQTLIQSIRGQFSTNEAQGRVVLRRLNRTEYQNTVCDLFGIKINLKSQLPEDGEANGFDNAAAALHTSPFLMERYLEAADMALDRAIVNGPRPPLIQTRIPAAETRQIKVTTESVFRHLNDAVVCFSSSPWQTVGLTGFYPPDGGNYRFRILAAGFQSEGKPVTYRVTAGQTRLAGKDGLVGYFDAPANQASVTEFIQYMEPRTTINILPYGLAAAQTVNAIGADKYQGPGLALGWVEVEGPLYDAWPPTSHANIFGDLEQAPAPTFNFSRRVEVVSQQPLVDAARILTKFTRRAFRRPVKPADVQPYLDIVKDKLAAEYTFEQAMRAALKGVLLSPEFLFLREAPGQLDDFALASRLSYFFWSSMPDEELFALAEQGKLSQPEVLRVQVERMLSDAKAAAFTENFVGQWLRLREIDFTEPSGRLYPEYDHMLKVSMIRETELFFEELLKHDLSVSNFIASDFSLINGRLARHYNIPGPSGWEFQKVKLPPDSHRGGVLTMASVLKVTANGTTTSPVMRGAWVLDRILGTPPSPPPDEVPGLDPDIRGATTIREQLASHRALETCASCHVKMDPPGFALESFDVIGGWREKYRVTGGGQPVSIDGKRMTYNEGKPVDPADVLADGRRFENIDQYKQLLLEDQDQIANALAVRLVAYATGSAPSPADQPRIEQIVANIRERDYGLRSLIHEVVKSELFQRK